MLNKLFFFCVSLYVMRWGWMYYKQLNVWNEFDYVLYICTEEVGKHIGPKNCLFKLIKWVFETIEFNSFYQL